MSGVPTRDQRTVFEDVVRDVVEPTRRFLLRRTDPVTADDVLSETLLVLWRRLEKVPDDRIPWAIGIARLQLANAARSQRRQDRLINKIVTIDPPRHSHTRDEDSTAEAVRSVLIRMRAADAEILRLWTWEDLTPAQIAVVLDVTTNAATVRLHRARKRFATEFGKTQHSSGHDQLEEGEDR